MLWISGHTIKKCIYFLIRPLPGSKNLNRDSFFAYGDSCLHHYFIKYTEKAVPGPNYE